MSDLKGDNVVETVRKIGPIGELAMRNGRPYAENSLLFDFIRGPEPLWYASGRWLPSSQVSTAHSRSQHYGSDSHISRWIDSQYDLEGLSDYASSSGEFIYENEAFSHSINVVINDDDLTENPDEFFNVRLSSPGMWPSSGGQLWSTVTITDNGDGGAGVQDYSDFLYASDPSAAAQFGVAVSIDDNRHIAAVGAPDTTVDGVMLSGAVYIFLRISGVWSFEAKLQPGDGVEANMLFGKTVAVDGSLGTVRVLIGAPGRVAAYVFLRSGTSWSQETKLVPPGSDVSKGHQFGASISLYSDFAVIGTTKEAVYVYERLYTGWGAGQLLRSPDYDYDIVDTKNVIHETQFGSSVAVHGRTIIVGAPLADYGNTGTAGVETFNTQSVNNAFFGTGAVYAFYRAPQVQTVALRFDSPPTAGTFALTLTHRSITDTVGMHLNYDATALDMKNSLESLSNVENVKVTRWGNTGDGFVWAITFFSEVAAVPLLTPVWDGYGCTGCTAFTTDYSADSAAQIIVTDTTTIGAWSDHGKLVAPNSHAADRFGHSLDLSGNQAIVGAYHSPSLTSTSWDFEAGNLVGWDTTGTAFDTQPTFGDNSYARGVYDGYASFTAGVGQRSFHEGRYWVGTFENHPGKGHLHGALTQNQCSFAMAGDCQASEYKLGSGTIDPGNTQGDEPQGTLTSQPFIVQGSSITFRIGGGCDDRVEYVELLIDGISRKKATGKCRETMEVVTWSVAAFQNQTGQVRLVDASSGNWGHINFDDVRFDWSIAQEDSRQAGVAYTFRRKDSNSIAACLGSMDQFTECDWEFEARLTASDKRSDDRLGVQVAIDDKHGIALIGAPGHGLMDQNNSMVNDVTSAGAVYVYLRTNEIIDALGETMAIPKWNIKEHAMFQGRQARAYDSFGLSVALDGYSALIGSPGRGDFNDGASQVIHIGFATVAFSSSEYAVMENVTTKHLAVIVTRSGSTAAALTIGYATSDRSAVGVDTAKHAACWLQHVKYRAGCGDYAQIAGELTFNIGDVDATILVPIMDDACREPDPEYIYMGLHVPGGVLLHGQNYRTHIRIDDDDFDQKVCS